MSKPNDIPQDVWESARSDAAVFVSMFDMNAGQRQHLSEVFARTVLAERERCMAALVALQGSYVEALIAKPHMSFVYSPRSAAIEDAMEALRKGGV